MGFGEIVIVVIVALLFIGPEKLPQAAKSISKGIRDIRRQTRELRETIDDDNEIGEAIRDLQSALRGDDIHRPPARRGKVLAQKAGAPGTTVESLGPGPEAGAASAAGAGAAAGAAVAGADPGQDRDSAEAASVAEPVISPPDGAIARASVAADAAPSSSTPDAKTGDAAGSPEEPDGDEASGEPASGRAHG